MVAGVVVVVVVVVVVAIVVVVAGAAVVAGASVTAKVPDVDSEPLPPHAAAIRARDPSMRTARRKHLVLPWVAAGLVPNIAPSL